MALWIEIQVSVSGIEEGSFSALATIADAAGADTYHHTGVTPGQLYIYRFRRFDDATGLRSAWSCLVFARIPLSLGGNTMPSCLDSVRTGSETELYIGIEACEGIPTQAQWLAAYRSGGLEGTYTRLYDQRLRNSTTMRRNAVLGRIEYTGELELQVTPEGAFPRFLLATFPVTTTNLTSPTRYRHRFSNLRGAKTFTLVQRIGDEYYVYPGCRVNSLNIGVAEDQEDVLIAQFEIVALDEWVFPLDLVPTTPTLLGTSGAGEDPLPNYSPTDGTIQIGSFDCNGKSINFSINKGLGKKGVLCGKAGAASYFERRAEITATLQVFYTGDEFQAQAMGAGTPVAQYGPGGTLSFIPVNIVFNPANNGAGFSNILTIAVPNADVVSKHKVDGPDEIMETLEISPIDVQGDASGTDFYIEITNSITNANLIAAGAAIRDAPSSRARSYNYGVVKTGASTTSISTDSTHLSATDDAYNGRTMRFLTGALAGVSKAISDYTGSTKTFTVAAFASAPAAGDIFEID